MTTCEYCGYMPDETLYILERDYGWKYYYDIGWVCRPCSEEYGYE